MVYKAQSRYFIANPSRSTASQSNGPEATADQHDRTCKDNDVHSQCFRWSSHPYVPSSKRLGLESFFGILYKTRGQAWFRSKTLWPHNFKFFFRQRWPDRKSDRDMAVVLESHRDSKTLEENHRGPRFLFMSEKTASWVFWADIDSIVSLYKVSLM